MGAESKIEQHLRSLEEQLFQPEVYKDVSCVAKLLSDDFIEFGSSGYILSKQDVIEGLQWGEGIRFILSEFKSMQLAPDVVLVTYRAARRDSDSGALISSLRSSIWKYIDNRWQIVFHQGTLVKDVL